MWHQAVVAFAVLLSFSLSVSVAADARSVYEKRLRAADRYWAVMRDGSIVIGKDLKEWHSTKSNPALNGKPLFDPNNPLRLIRDTTIQAKLDGPYVEFANGDVLPGKVVGGMPADARSRLPAHLIVAVAAPLAAFDPRGNEVAVDPRTIVRVVVSREARGPVDPGTVQFADGRKVKVRAIRWVLGGVRALTEEGAFTAGWIELAEVHPPGVDAVAALLDDVLSPQPRLENATKADLLVGRVVASNGAVLTYRRSMLRIDNLRTTTDRSYYHMVQPAWALEAIRVPFDEVVSRSYRDPQETPLSLLPAAALKQQGATGFTWPWRRHESVRGAELALDELRADLGLGTHSYSEITFDLPASAKHVSTWVGINRNVGNGGCAKVKICRDAPNGPVLWQSDFLRGGQDAVKVGPLAVEGAKRIVLVTDMAHDGRPPGSDPLDIRDEVDWLYPTVAIDLAAAARTHRQLEPHEIFPQLEDWTISEDVRKRIGFRPFWHERAGRWMQAMYVDPSADRFEQLKPFELTRKMKVTHANAWLPLSAMRDDGGQTGHELTLWADGKQIGSALNGDVKTLAKGPGEEDLRHYSLGEHIGKEVTVTLKLTPQGGNGQRPGGVLLGWMTPQPVVRNLPPDGQPIKPQVSITSLKLLASTFRREGTKGELEKGKAITTGKPLTELDVTYDDGYGLPPGASELVYALDPSWKRFVAVIGMCDGWQGAGPFEILLDDKVAWQSEQPAAFGRTDPSLQIDLAIPEGHKTITLRVGKANQAGAAWAMAGFMKE